MHPVEGFHYVYIPVSERDGTRHYTGLTGDLASRIAAHNGGQVPHTAKYRPWRIETAVAFSSRLRSRRHLHHSARAGICPASLRA